MMRATQHFYLGVFKISKYCMLQYVHVCCVQDVVSRCCIYSRMQLARLQLSESTGVVRVCYRTCKTRFDATTKFRVVGTSLFNLVISSFPDNMFYHA